MGHAYPWGRHIECVNLCVHIHIHVYVLAKQWDSDSDNDNGNDNAYSIMSLSTFMLGKCKNLQRKAERQIVSWLKHIHAFYNVAKAPVGPKFLAVNNRKTN